MNFCSLICNTPQVHKFIDFVHLRSTINLHQLIKINVIVKKFILKLIEHRSSVICEQIYSFRYCLIVCHYVRKFQWFSFSRWMLKSNINASVTIFDYYWSSFLHGQVSCQNWKLINAAARTVYFSNLQREVWSSVKSILTFDSTTSHFELCTEC